MRRNNTRRNNKPRTTNRDFKDAGNNLKHKNIPDENWQRRVMFMSLG